MDSKLALCCSCLFLQLFSGFLVIVGGVLYTSHHKAGLYIILTALVIYFFTICGSAISFVETVENANVPITCCLCTFSSFVPLGCIIYVIVLLVNAYRKDSSVDFSVTSATLTQFNLTNNFTTLNYNLSLNVAVGPGHNNLASGVCFAKLEACSYYQGHNFSCLSLPPFHLGGNSFSSSTAGVLQSMVFQGQQELGRTGDWWKRYQRDAGAGRFSIVVTVSYLGFKLAKTDSEQCNLSGDTDRTLIVMSKAHNLKGVATLELKDVALSSVAGNSRGGGGGGEELPVSGKAESVSKSLRTLTLVATYFGLIWLVLWCCSTCSIVQLAGEVETVACLVCWYGLWVVFFLACTSMGIAYLVLHCIKALSSTGFLLTNYI